MKVNQMFHYHPEKAQGVRTSLLLELYQTLSQLGTYNCVISAAQREGVWPCKSNNQAYHSFASIAWPQLYQKLIIVERERVSNHL